MTGIRSWTGATSAFGAQVTVARLATSAPPGACQRSQTAAKASTGSAGAADRPARPAAAVAGPFVPAADRHQAAARGRRRPTWRKASRTRALTMVSSTGRPRALVRPIGISPQRIGGEPPPAPATTASTGRPARPRGRAGAAAAGGGGEVPGEVGDRGVRKTRSGKRRLVLEDEGTFMFTRYSAIWPSLTTTFWSCTQAPSTFFRVLRGAGDALLQRVLEALLRRRGDLGDACDAHGVPPLSALHGPRAGSSRFRRRRTPAAFPPRPAGVCRARRPPMPPTRLAAAAPSLDGLRAARAPRLRRAAGGGAPRLRRPRCSGSPTSRPTRCSTRWGSRIPTS